MPPPDAKRDPERPRSDPRPLTGSAQAPGPGNANRPVPEGSTVPRALGRRPAAITRSARCVRIASQAPSARPHRALRKPPSPRFFGLFRRIESTFPPSPCQRPHRSRRGGELPPGPSPPAPGEDRGPLPPRAAGVGIHPRAGTPGWPHILRMGCHLARRSCPLPMLQVAGILTAASELRCRAEICDSPGRRQPTSRFGEGGGADPAHPQPLFSSSTWVPGGGLKWKTPGATPWFSWTSLNRTSVRLPKRSTTTDSRIAPLEGSTTSSRCS